MNIFLHICESKIEKKNRQDSSDNAHSIRWLNWILFIKKFEKLIYQQYTKFELVSEMLIACIRSADLF